MVYNVSMKLRGFVLLAAGCVACGQSEPSPDEAFEALAARYVDESMAFNPVAATFTGDHRFDGELDEVGSEARERSAMFARSLLAELATIPREALTRPNQVDAALLRNSLEGSLWRQEELQEWAWNPTRYTGLAGGAVYSLMARDYAPVTERLSRVEFSSTPERFGTPREELHPPAINTNTISTNATTRNIEAISKKSFGLPPFSAGLGPRFQSSKYWSIPPV